MPVFKEMDSGQLNVGDVITFSYKGKQVHDKNPEILYLGVDPHNMKLFHGINLHYLTKEQVNKLREVFWKPELVKAQKIDSNPKEFYETHIQPVLGRIGVNCYRTYTADKIYGMTKLGKFTLKQKPKNK